MREFVDTLQHSSWGREDELESFVTDLAGVQETGLKTRPRNKEDKIKEVRLEVQEVMAQEISSKDQRAGRRAG
jgi:hypothetical protein